MKLNDFYLFKDNKEFINIDISDDGKSTQRFINPYSLINLKPEDIGHKYHLEIISIMKTFFEDLLNVSIDDDPSDVLRINQAGGEAKYICLGYGKTKLGKGIGQEKLSSIAESIRNSPAFKSRLISDISDMTLYISGVSDDMMSDLLANLLMPILSKIMIDYLKELSKDRGEDIVKRYTRKKEIQSYNHILKKWEQIEIDVFVYKSGEFILVPECFCNTMYSEEKIIGQTYDDKIRPIIEDLFKEENDVKPKSRKEGLYFILSKKMGEDINYKQMSSTIKKGSFLSIIKYLYDMNLFVKND